MAEQWEMFASDRMSRIRVRADQFWKSSVSGLVILGIAALVFGYWSWHIPSPGKAVPALAVLAAIMTFRADVGGLEKFVWMGVLFAFLFLELRAINKDRKEFLQEQESARKEDHRAFQLIADEIKDNIKQDQDNFNA